MQLYLCFKVHIQLHHSNEWLMSKSLKIHEVILWRVWLLIHLIQSLSWSSWQSLTRQRSCPALPSQINLPGDTRDWTRDNLHAKEKNNHQATSEIFGHLVNPSKPRLAMAGSTDFSLLALHCFPLTKTTHVDVFLPLTYFYTIKHFDLEDWTYPHSQCCSAKEGRGSYDWVMHCNFLPVW